MFIILIYQIVVLNVISLENYREGVGLEGLLFTVPLYTAILINVVCMASNYDGLTAWIVYLTILPVIGAVTYFSLIKLLKLK